MFVCVYLNVLQTCPHLRKSKAHMRGRANINSHFYDNVSKCYSRRVVKCDMMIIISQVPCHHSQRSLTFRHKHLLNECFLMPRRQVLCKQQTQGNTQGLGFDSIPKVNHYTSMYMWSLGTTCVQTMHTIQILPHVQSTLDAAVRVEKDMSPVYHSALTCSLRGRFGHKATFLQPKALKCWTNN